MSLSENTKRVAVIGGGILGVSTALHLQRQGASTVIISESELASGASGRSLSWLNSAGKRSDPYHALRVAGIDRYRTMFAADPTREWLRFDGGLYWSTPEREPAILARHAYEKAHAYDSHLIGPESLPSHAPGLNPNALPPKAIFNPGEGWVSLPELMNFLIEEYKGLGGELALNAGKASVVVTSGRATGVSTLDRGSYEADAVVVACGPWTPSVISELGVVIEDASTLSMVVITEPVDHNTKAVMNTPRAAARPNPGSTLALDHEWYVDQIIEDDNGNCSIPETAVHELVDEASKLLGEAGQLKAASWKLGRKPIPGDGEPVLGQLDSVPGCFVAFSHSGATVGLVAGELLADEILTGIPHPMLKTFKPERFGKV
jgi:glycine/D-amino acid oxidase-like deaminating enzyme